MIRGGNIGRMDTQIIIESSIITREPVTGEQVHTWSTFATVWAEKMRMPISNEVIEADQQVARKVSKWKVRSLAVTETMRVNRGGEISYISGIEEIDRNKFLVLTTEKRDNG